MNFNINFCLDKNKKSIYYCCIECNKNRCPTLSNIWYGYIINPLISLIDIIRNKFTKCDKVPTRCSFLFCKKYCELKGKCN